MAAIAKDWRFTCGGVEERWMHVLQSGEMSDVTFLVGVAEEQVLAHRLVLSVASAVFEELLHDAPARVPVRVPDVQPGHFKTMLWYIYLDYVDIESVYEARELCQVAQKYSLPQLIKICTQYVSDNMNCENACVAYEYGKQFNNPKIMENALKIISDETKNALSENVIKNIDTSTLITIFKMETLNISELELFNVAVQYSKFKGIGRTSSLTESHLTIYDLVKNIKFRDLTPQQFSEGPGLSSLLTDTDKLAIIMSLTSPQHYNLPNGFSKDSREMLYCTRKFDNSDKFLANSYQCNFVNLKSNAAIRLFGVKIPTQTGPIGHTYSERIKVNLIQHDVGNSLLASSSIQKQQKYNDFQDLYFDTPVNIEANKNYIIFLSHFQRTKYPSAVGSIEETVDKVTFNFNHHNNWTDPIRVLIFKLNM